MPEKLMAQKDFIDQLKARVPELKDFNDNTLMNEVFKRKPELRDKIENPMAGDAAAAQAQGKAEAASKSIVDPEFWNKHPNTKAFSKMVLDTLPGVGAIGGGLLATPETMGLGTGMGTALGAGVGRGVRDVLAEGTGLEPRSSSLNKMKNIGMDTGLTAITPGVTEAAMHPVDTARMAAKSYMKLTPKALSPWIHPEMLDEFANATPKRTPVMPDFENVPVKTGEVVPPGGIKNGQAFTEGESYNNSIKGKASPMEGAKRLLPITEEDWNSPNLRPGGFREMNAPKKLTTGETSFYGGTETGNTMKSPLSIEQMDRLGELDRFIQSVLRNR